MKMKNIILLLLTVSLFSCKEQTKQQKAEKIAKEFMKDNEMFKDLKFEKFGNLVADSVTYDKTKEAEKIMDNIVVVTDENKAKYDSLSKIVEINKANFKPYLKGYWMQLSYLKSIDTSFTAKNIYFMFDSNLNLTGLKNENEILYKN